MPRTITEAEINANLAQFIAEAGDGEEFIIDRGTAPAVRLMPLQPFIAKTEDLQARRGKAIAAIKELRKNIVIGPPITIEEIISARDEGRKYL